MKYKGTEMILFGSIKRFPRISFDPGKKLSLIISIQSIMQQLSDLYISFLNDGSTEYVLYKLLLYPT